MQSGMYKYSINDSPRGDDGDDDDDGRTLR